MTRNWSGQWWRQLIPTSEPDVQTQRSRIWFLERNVGLPVRCIYLAWVLYYLFFSLHDLADTGELSLEAIVAVQQIFLVYLLFNVGIALLLFGMDHVPLKVLLYAVFTVALGDAVFLAALTLVEDGFDSTLYWIFVGLIIRNAITFPRPDLQIFLNVAVTFCYLAAGSLDLAILKADERFPEAGAAEPFAVRVALLLLMTACCYGVEILFEKQRQQEEEAREFAIRQEQLRSTGRLAAEIAHQMKNPLGIINNAAFTLQHALKKAEGPVMQQVQIIRDEVERTDRILTELMGYAQLVEGHVEKLNVAQELDWAIEQVFPSKMPHSIQIHRQYASVLPPLLVQRRHLQEIFVNLLTNAQEAMGGEGHITIRAEYAEGYSVRITFEDDGPGMDPETQQAIFDAYFTTKEGGTGLGMAIVKHNIEMYGGSVEVESELGKGTRFTLWFPGRTVLRLRK